MDTPTRRELRPSYFYTIALLIFIADQYTKRWISTSMPWDSSRSIVGNKFMLTLTQNTGGAWGLLPKGNVIFMVFAAIAIVVLLIAYHKLLNLELLPGSAFALALGGAVGNLTDRIRLGYVVDFFDARIIRWPIFNVADSAITVGICLLMIHFFRASRAESTEATEAVKTSP